MSLCHHCSDATGALTLPDATVLKQRTGSGLHTEVGQMVREKWRSMLASCCHGSDYVPDKRLGQLLKQWGGDEEEGVHLAEKDAVDKERRLKVLGEDLTAQELKEVLQVSHYKLAAWLFSVCPHALPAVCACTVFPVLH